MNTAPTTASVAPADTFSAYGDRYGRELAAFVDDGRQIGRLSRVCPSASGPRSPGAGASGGPAAKMTEM